MNRWKKKEYKKERDTNMNKVKNINKIKNKWIKESKK